MRTLQNWRFLDGPLKAKQTCTSLWVEEPWKTNDTLTWPHELCNIYYNDAVADILMLNIYAG